MPRLVERCLTAVTLALSCGTMFPQGNSSEAIKKWQRLVPAIQTALARQGASCPVEAHVGPIDAADFAGTSFALVDSCRGGAYTDLITAMHLESGKPVLSRFRKDGRVIDIEFAQGSSVMHGKDVKLVPGRHAIYDISWDDNGQDLHLQRCVVDAYIWNPKSKTFGWNPKATREITASYCQKLEKQLIGPGR